ncbi:hypothetical protein COM83_25435 [Bacillus cereus]|nr:hypothetical protein COM83_25435 [Bacillus cereus]PFJ57037.1 hypothetical protein COI99_00560 [Bacillus cereus]PFW19289.1 hypothetical protein COL18_02065 [Bacillus cereus]PGW95299.1 hypothetical protein COE40_27605 [Bacillus cereus]PGY07848.1 hypothetical protein COE16_29305 [Bacillus cereus]
MLLAWLFSEILEVPHCYQTRKSKYPKTRKLTSPSENVQFFVLGHYKILKLMGMGSLYQKKKIVRLDTF